MASIKSLRDYYSTVKSAGLRVEHEFAIEIGAPSFALAQGFNDYIVYALSANLPGREIETQPTPYFGFDFQVPVNTKYTQTWDLTIRLDKDMVVRNLFEVWFDRISNLAYSTGGSKGIIPSDSYAMVHMLSPDFFNTGTGSVSRSYRLEGVFPSRLGDVRLDHGGNGIATFDVTLTFQYWSATVIGGDTSNVMDPLR